MRPSGKLIATVAALTLGLTLLLISGTPPDPGDECCVTNYTPHATHDVVYPPKQGGYTDHRGVMTPAEIHFSGTDVSGGDLYLEWSAGMDAQFTLVGGDDWDVCVRDGNPDLWYDLDIPEDVSWTGSAPGSVDVSNDRLYHIASAPQPDDGEIDDHTLTGTADDTGPCNATDADEQRSASVAVHTYFRYHTGDTPDGEILDKPAGLFLAPDGGTFRFDDQLVNYVAPWGIPSQWFFSSSTWDLDDLEDDAQFSGPVLWNDGPIDDPPAASDITWEDNNMSTETGAAVALDMPVPFLTEPFTWIVRISVDDDGNPERADDDEQEDLDSVTYRVYRDHLWRDMDNLTRLNQPKPGETTGLVSPGNCHGAAQHAYNGVTAPGSNPPWSPPTTPVTIFRVDDLNPSTTPTVDLTQTYSFTRGGVVVMGAQTAIMHTATCTGNGNATWEFNGREHNPSCWGPSTVSNYRDLLRDPRNPSQAPPNGDPRTGFTTLFSGPSRFLRCKNARRPQILWTPFPRVSLASLAPPGAMTFRPYGAE